MRRCAVSLALALTACHHAPSLPLVLDVDAGGDVTDVDAAVGASMAWWSLPAPTRAALATALTELGDRARLRAQPGWVGLDDDEPLLRPIAQQLVPVFTAADALAPGRWALDGRAIAAVRACPPRHRCLALDGDDEPRIRFAAWPIARAMLVPTSAASKLRDALLVPGTRIGLVVTRDAPGDSEGASEIARVRAAAARLDPSRLPPSLARLVDGLARLDATRAPPWLPLPPTRALVVPRLAAAVAPAAFAAEVRQRVQ